MNVLKLKHYVGWTNTALKFLFENCYMIVKQTYLATDTSKQIKRAKRKNNANA